MSVLTSVDRGGVWNSRVSKHFRVTNTTFKYIDSDGVVTQLGTVAGSEQVALPFSFNTQAIIGGGNYYLYDSTNGFRQVTDPDVGNPIDAVWVDSYYFFTDGEYLYHTDINNESSIDPLKFATSEFSPDPTVGVGLTPDNKVIAFNLFTTEFFQDTANENFAFTRLPGRAVFAGIISPQAKVRIDGVYYCMGGPSEKDIGIFALGTGVITGISTRRVNQIIRSYSFEDLQNSRLETYTLDDYTYLIVHLPDDVLMCNMKLLQAAGPEQAWSVLKSGNGIATDIAYRGINGIYDQTIPAWIYGDKLLNVRGKLDPTLGTQYGFMAECCLTTPFIYLETGSLDELEINTVPGFNVQDDATVLFSTTYDGESYSQETALSYGAPSDYIKRFIARRLGYVRNWFAFRFRWVSTSRMAFALGKLRFS